MELLNLSLQSQIRQLPASQFPEPADSYVCDKCGRDISAHLYRGRAHVLPPLGPVRYTCVCGERYMSGAAEWDNLSDWSQRRWLSDVWLAAIILIGLLLYSVLVYRAVIHRSILILGSLALVLLPLIPLLPLLTAIVATPFEIAASIWRTRVLGASQTELDS